MPRNIGTFAQIGALTLAVFISASSFADQTYVTFDSEGFAQKMGIQPFSSFESIPKFISIVGTDTSAQADLDLAFATYKCQIGVSVTLIPMVHVADPAYYGAADRIASQSDVLLFEGVRPNGFFGPPLDIGADIMVSGDNREITERRLRSMAEAVQDFRKINHRNPRSIADMYTNETGYPLAFAKIYSEKLYQDAWGRPLKLTVLSDGGIEISSADISEKIAPLPTIQPKNGDKKEANSPNLTELYSQLAAATGLTPQVKFEMKSYIKPTSINADISMDMLKSPDLPREARVANNNLRNVLPMATLDELISTSGNPPKSVAIMYGAEHMPKFHQYLTGARLGCQLQRMRWMIAIGSNKANNLSAEQRQLRKSLVLGIGKVPQTLNPDPLKVAGGS